MNQKQEPMGKDMDTITDNNNSLLRLLHLVSPNLPTGAFSYSQGLEWAVEVGWVHDGKSLQDWLEDLTNLSLTSVDIPILCRMYRAIHNEELSALEKWCATLLACRETSELRMEEQTRGRAFTSLLQGLDIPGSNRYQDVLNRSQLAGFTLAAVHWNIPVEKAAFAYSWAWLENQILTGVKIIPLGQTEGQRLLLQISSNMSEAINRGLILGDEEIGSSAPALALACSLHETQYTRLFRS